MWITPGLRGRAVAGEVVSEGITEAPERLSAAQRLAFCTHRVQLDPPEIKKK